MDVLRDFAKTVSAGKAIDLNSADFVKMCDRLPRAADLPNSAKQDLGTLFDYAKAKKNGKAQDRLFEVRFGIALDDEWATNKDPNDIDTIWKLMRSVPVNNVEGNVNLKEIELIAGGGGAYQWSGIIQIGRNELPRQESFEDVLRHEVGHAVQSNKASIVDPWLKSKFGWQQFTADQNSIDQWVGLMGGWDHWPSELRFPMHSSRLWALAVSGRRARGQSFRLRIRGIARTLDLDSQQNNPRRTGTTPLAVGIVRTVLRSFLTTGMPR
jgi:hypothetical protein